MPTEQLIVISGPVVDGTKQLQEYHPEFIPQFLPAGVNLFQASAGAEIVFFEQLKQRYLFGLLNGNPLENADVFSKLDQLIANIGEPGARPRAASTLELARQVISNQKRASANRGVRQTQSLADDLAKFTD